MEKTYVANKGAGMVSTIIGLVVAIIVLVAVAIPVTTEIIDSANLTGTTATVVGLMPLFLGLLGLLMVAALYG
ncbi:MAG: hypothetical protein PHS46_08625 [Candidatus Omnitrophica bacterium]|nr:hypothetical protein [Candidatus Omnitrophota bacterium]